MRPTRLADKLVQMERGKAMEDLIPLDYTMTRWKMKKKPLFFIDPAWQKQTLKVEDVFEKIREVVKRYGIKFVVFDHLHFLVRSLQYVTAEIGQVTRGFKLLAEELEIVMILIAQPRKTNSTKPITSEDLKDSQSIHADADQVVIMHRDPIPAKSTDLENDETQEVLDPKMLVRIDAARFRGGGQPFLYYDGATARFYSWEDRPIEKL
jgi:replicative DNA helicase